MTQIKRMLKKISKEFGYKHFSTIATLIHAVDVIDIVTPNFYIKCAKLLSNQVNMFLLKNQTQLEEAEEIIALPMNIMLKVK
jgi:hypothetical protein